MGEMRNAYKILVGKPEMKGHSEDLRVDGNISEWILEQHDGKVWKGIIWFRIGTSGWLCEHGNELSGIS
jgi:hypothetical protein